MENINLTNIYLKLAKRFGFNEMKVSSILPTNREPIDMLMYFNGGNMKESDLGLVETIIKNNTNTTKNINISLKNSTLEIYVEFGNSNFIDDLF